MIWVKYNSLDEFNKWHDTIKTELGLPKISVDINGNLVPEAILTTEYVTSHIVSTNDIRALIDEEYLGSLQISESPFTNNYSQS